MLKRNRQQHKPNARSAWAFIIAGVLLCAVCGRVLFLMIAFQRTGFPDAEADQADKLLILPAILKMFVWFIGTPLFYLFLFADVIGLLYGCQALISGIAALCRQHRLRQKENAETEQKLNALRDDGALTEEEYQEMMERLNRTSRKQR